MLLGTVAFVAVVAWSVGPNLLIVCDGLSKSRITTRQMAEIARAIDRFRAREGHLPARLADLQAPEPSDRAAGLAVGGDAWGTPNLYVVLDADRYELRSLGADGAPGGEEEDEDIVWTSAPPSSADR